MPNQSHPGGAFTFPSTEITVNRMGYGAMQLAGPHIFGPPKDRPAAIAVLQEALASGVNHIDTSDFYGPHVTNQIIREALHPYPEHLTIVTKVGAVRGADASWNPALSPAQLTQAVHDNLRNLGLEALDVVNLRVGGLEGPAEFSIEAPFTALASLQQQGLIHHLGLSNVSPTQLAEAQKIAAIVCIQNLYNVAHRTDDAFIDDLAMQGIAYVPFFPLGGFTPLQSSTLDEVAARTRRHAHAGSARLAPAPLAQHPPHPRNLIPNPPAREPRRRRPDPPTRSPGRTKPNRQSPRLNHKSRVPHLDRSLIAIKVGSSSSTKINPSTSKPNKPNLLYPESAELNHRSNPCPPTPTHNPQSKLFDSSSH
jgi:pyridoxine 4-dehydrogenase